MTKVRVAVIGAGASGLCAAKHILTSPNCFAPPVVFELSGNIGGTWVYDERTGTRDNGRPIHSSMYRDLRTNVPKEVMKFPDFPFEPQEKSFLSHQEVLRYLESYCDSHNIRPHIRLNTVVENVKPVVMTTEGEEEEKTVWEVTSSDSSGCWKTETFDAVFVCTGHFSDPHIPDIPGIENFKGKVLHSHNYRYAEPFSGQSVVVLGAGFSGVDISIELTKVDAQVTLSHGRPRFNCPLPSGMQQAGPIEAIQEDGSIRFQDGSVSEADVLLFCTGYNFKYPFLDAAQLGVEIHDHLITPLYRLLIPPAFPTLFFIGICKLICPYPNFYCQVRFAVATLDGTVTLPTRAQMEDEVHRDIQEKLARGVKLRHILSLDTDQWEYCHSLARMANFPPLPPVIRSLFEEARRQRAKNPENYQNLRYRVISDSQWELIE
ncbi:flavin-containing monooxygenase FMO GS-OX4-like [Toxotes jaculatrix]|uniref:flavin-containing monooxygenase FMO GS-OX4-like n=1 Tax=Toxotes jaculatrix TaxID=941984 RepID=UPI001B3AB8D0|nr:flavin-containing monooxygenase FMO GS-OX4-like [Toxotes jaculatrix]